jgi:hypothetical protein
MNRIINWQTLPFVAFFGSCVLLLLSLGVLWRAHVVSHRRVAVVCPEKKNVSSTKDAVIDNRSANDETNGASPVGEGDIQCKNVNVDRGDVRIGDVVEHTFQLFNAAQETRHILNVKPGCSCTKVSHFSKEIGPQSEGEVTVVIDTTGMPNLRQSSVLIETDDPKVPRLNPLVACHVLPAVEAAPAQFQFVRDKTSGTFPTTTFELTGLYEGETISLGEIHPSDPMIVVNKLASTEGEPLRIEVTVKPEIAAGITLAHLLIDIEGSLQKSMRLPLSVINGLKLKAEPTQLDLAMGKEAQTVEFTLKTLDGSSLAVKSAKLEGKPLHIVPEQIADGVVRVQINDLMVSHSFSSEHVEVMTDQGEVRLPTSAHPVLKK